MAATAWRLDQRVTTVAVIASTTRRSARQYGLAFGDIGVGRASGALHRHRDLLAGEQVLRLLYFRGRQQHRTGGGFH